MPVPLSNFAKRNLRFRDFPVAPGFWRWTFILVFSLMTIIFFGLGISHIEEDPSQYFISGVVCLVGAALSTIPFFSYRTARAKVLAENEAIHARIIAQNEDEFNLAQSLNKSLIELGSNSLHSVNDTTKGMRVYRKYSIGEITRHFDTQTNAQITGWLNHSLSGNSDGFTSGFTSGTTFDQGSYSNNSSTTHMRNTSTVNIGGQSNVILKQEGVGRDNLVGDGFVAVLEQKTPSGIGDIVRIVVPSEPASRENVSSLLSHLSNKFGEGSFCKEAFSQNSTRLQSSIHYDASYVSDRLSSILRMEPDKRPAVTVVGEELTEHAILAGAIQFDNDQKWYQLYPLSFIHKVSGIAFEPGKIPRDNPKLINA